MDQVNDYLIINLYLHQVVGINELDYRIINLYIHPVVGIGELTLFLYSLPFSGWILSEKWHF
jgi:hypothetical protein